jgi:hypothetical protein
MMDVKKAGPLPALPTKGGNKKEKENGLLGELGSNYIVYSEAKYTFTVSLPSRGTCFPLCRAHGLQSP